MKLLYSETITLFLVMDSLGVVPIALASLKKVNPKRHTFILFRESIIAFLILTLFLFFGDYFLQSLNITQAPLPWPPSCCFQHNNPNKQGPCYLLCLLHPRSLL